MPAKNSDQFKKNKKVTQVESGAKEACLGTGDTRFVVFRFRIYFEHDRRYQAVELDCHTHCESVILVDGKPVLSESIRSVMLHAEDEGK